MLDEGCAIIISDKIVEIGGRVYVEATCSFCDGDDAVTTTAYARESLAKKGMDESQITGSTSSYARKYALNGMFAIDDCKDVDTMDNRAQLTSQPEPPKIDIKPAIAIQKPTESVHNASVDIDPSTGEPFNDGGYEPGAMYEVAKKTLGGYAKVYGIQKKPMNDWITGTFGQSLAKMQNDDGLLTKVLKAVKEEYLPTVGAVDIGGIAGKVVK
jgi:hypothetical protein